MPENAAFAAINRRCHLKTCHIFPVTVGDGVFQWKWRCVDGKRKFASARAFERFYDCVEDARNHGADVDLSRVPDEIAAAESQPKAAASRS